VYRWEKLKENQSLNHQNEFWLDLDGCWLCKNRRNCGNCKVLKKIVVNEKRKERKHDVKRDC